MIVGMNNASLCKVALATLHHEMHMHAHTSVRLHKPSGITWSILTTVIVQVGTASINGNLVVLLLKKHVKKKRKHVSSSDSETSEDDPVDAQQRVKDHAALARQVFDNNMARIKGEVVCKSLFPYLQG